MCKTCGCDEAGLRAEAAHHPENGHGPRHDHEHGPNHDGRIVKLERAVLAKNDELAERNRAWLAARRVVALNLVSAPGAGKTALLERTLRDLRGEFPLQVIEGDQASDHDARRIRDAGGRVVQINTGAGCHLDAAMAARALEELDPSPGSVLFIENVGNLVCPALFDLGERAKVVVCSVTEGDDKPAKYPHVFRASSLLVLNKIDLLPYVRFDAERCLQFARQANASLQVVRLSAARGDGLADWYAWLREQAALSDRR